MKHTHVTLEYFRETGKYYSGGELAIPHLETRPVMFHEALEEVAKRLNAGERPGLIDGMDFDVLVTVYTEYGPLQHMFVRDADGNVGATSARVQRAHA